MSIKSRLKRTLRVLLNKEPINQIDKRTQLILNILLEKSGNRLSAEKQSSIDANGSPVPWFTYPSIEYISQVNLSSFSVIEWGCGNSTRYFSERCKEITSIESNKEWFEKISLNKPKNCNLFVKENEVDYISFPKILNKLYDIIIIDGVYREGCVNTALGIHSKNGFIILDNSERYPELCEIIREKNYLEIDFHGFGPINNYTWTTSLFFHPQAFDKINPIRKQPIIPIGGGY